MSNLIAIAYPDKATARAFERAEKAEQKEQEARIRDAAPEMLDALEEAEFALRSAADQYATDKGRRSTILDGRLGIVRVAIAKAKGGAA